MKRLLAGLALLLAGALYGLAATPYSPVYLPGEWPAGKWWTNSPAATNVYASNAWLAVNHNFTTASNFLATNAWTWATPVWRDQIVSGMALGFGASAPGAVVVSGGFIRGLAFAHGEDAHAACQLNHDLAGTNAWLPDFYVGPHIHISATSLAAGTNATFRLCYEWANIGGTYTNLAGCVTNSLSFTNLYTHRILDFGYITNNGAQGSISTIFRFGLERLNGGAGDMGNTRCVVVDSVDVHYPVSRLGSGYASSD